MQELLGFIFRGMNTLSNEEGVSRIKIKFLIEGLGEAEGELVRFLAPRTIDYYCSQTSHLKAEPPYRKKKSTLKSP